MGAGFSRRDMMRWSLLGAASTPIAAMIAACHDETAGQRVTGSTTSPTAGTLRPTTVPPTVPPTGPPSTVPFDPPCRGGCKATTHRCMEEIEAFDLEVRGALPPELSGLYVKNGSNPPPRGLSRTGSSATGWCTGCASRAVAPSGIATDTCDTEPYSRARVRTGRARRGGEPVERVGVLARRPVLTSGEVGFPYELDPDDLSTMGAYDFGGALTGAFTAHPKIDPATGRMHSFGYGFTPPFLTYHVIEPDGTMVHRSPVDIPRSTMIHDFRSPRPTSSSGTCRSCSTSTSAIG